MLAQMQQRQGSENESSPSLEEDKPDKYRHYFDGYFDPDGSRFHFRRTPALDPRSYLSSQADSLALVLDEPLLRDMHSHNLDSLESSLKPEPGQKEEKSNLSYNYNKSNSPSLNPKPAYPQKTDSKAASIEAGTRRVNSFAASPQEASPLENKEQESQAASADLEANKYRAAKQPAVEELTRTPDLSAGPESEGEKLYEYDKYASDKYESNASYNSREKQEDRDLYASQAEVEQEDHDLYASQAEVEQEDHDLYAKPGRKLSKKTMTCMQARQKLSKKMNTSLKLNLCRERKYYLLRLYPSCPLPTRITVSARIFCKNLKAFHKIT